MPPATGISATLWAKAQNRFSPILRIVALEIAMAFTTPRRSPDISTIGTFNR